MNTEQLQNTPVYSAKWQQRFDFFAHLESLDTAEKKAAIRSLGFRRHIFINFNFIAFFFGFIYLFVLGMWKRNLSMIGITLLAYIITGSCAGILDLEISDTFARAIGLGVSAWYATSANMAYYLKEMKGYNGWNPFKFKV